MKKFLLLIVCGLCVVCCSKESADGIERFEGKYSGTCEYRPDEGSSSRHNITVSVKINSDQIVVRSVSGFSIPTIRYNNYKENKTNVQAYIKSNREYSTIMIGENSLHIDYKEIRNGSVGDEYYLDLGKD